MYKSDKTSEIHSCHFSAVTACEVDEVVRFLLSPVVDVTDSSLKNDGKMTQGCHINTRPPPRSEGRCQFFHPKFVSFSLGSFFLVLV